MSTGITDDQMNCNATGHKAGVGEDRVFWAQLALAALSHGEIDSVPGMSVAKPRRCMGLAGQPWYLVAWRASRRAMTMAPRSVVRLSVTPSASRPRGSGWMYSRTSINIAAACCRGRPDPAGLGLLVDHRGELNHGIECVL